jgi:ribA/ribD-fused uncharacterized protein
MTARASIQPAAIRAYDMSGYLGRGAGGCGLINRLHGHWLLWYQCGMTLAVADVRSVAQLGDLVDNGAQPKYLLFWGHRPPVGGGVGTGCLSQWWPAPFTVDGVVYPTAEHFMMAGKALLFGDTETGELIVRAPDPGAAKALGRQVRRFDEELWAQQRFGIVVTGNLAKFSQHPDLRTFLLATGERVLVEASRHDRVWGIGLGADDERAASPRTWQGLNLLGFALMEVRHRLLATNTTIDRPAG